MTRTSISQTSRAFALTAIAGFSLAAAGSAIAQDADPSEDAPEENEAAEEPKKQTKGEKRLAKLLEGRVAGEPKKCIRVLPTDPMTTIDKTAYVYGRGKTIWVQRTAKPERIDDRDALVTRRFGGGTQLCNVDVTTTIDPVTGITTGAVFFKEFVPYTRVKVEDKS